MQVSFEIPLGGSREEIIEAVATAKYGLTLLQNGALGDTEPTDDVIDTPVTHASIPAQTNGHVPPAPQQTITTPVANLGEEPVRRRGRPPKIAQQVTEAVEQPKTPATTIAASLGTPPADAPPATPEPFDFAKAMSTPDLPAIDTTPTKTLDELFAEMERQNAQAAEQPGEVADPYANYTDSDLQEMLTARVKRQDHGFTFLQRAMAHHRLAGMGDALKRENCIALLRYSDDHMAKIGATA